MQSQETNFYILLGVTQSATLEEIKKSFKKAALRMHPDKVKESEKENAKIKFQELLKAYEILSDPLKKAEYDHQLKYGGDKETFKSTPRTQFRDHFASNSSPSFFDISYSDFYFSQYESTFDKFEKKMAEKMKERAEKPKGGYSW